MSVCLKKMTKAMLFEMYDGFEYDPATFMDMADFYEYSSKKVSPEQVEKFYGKIERESDAVYFAILHDGAVIGDTALRHIDEEKRECELSIHLKNDSVKGKGFGTEAEKLAIEYAFSELGMKTVLADCILKNTRSQHILEKLGFRFVSEEDGFKKYRLERK